MFFDESGGALWTQSWDVKHKYFCGQYGVFCDEGQVKRLELVGNSLNGTIPTEIGDVLTKLELFDLSDNNLESTIPLSFENLKQIKILLSLVL